LTEVTQYSGVPSDFGSDPEPASSEVPGYYHATYTYDKAGNTLTSSVTTSADTQATTNTWDLEGHLASTDTSGPSGSHHVDYAYDDAGDRVSQAVDGTATGYLNDPSQAYDQVLQEYAPGGVLAETYVRGLDLIFEDRTAAAGT